MSKNSLNRRDFVKIITGSCAATLSVAGTSIADAKSEDPQKSGKKENDGLSWHDVRDWGIEGKGWADTEQFFDRLPARAQEIVRPGVWNLSRHSAGMLVRFETEANAIHACWRLRSASLAMPHMPASGVSGVDLYTLSDQGKWHWLATGQPTKVDMNLKLVDGLLPGRKSFLLYLPLYNGVESVEIGVPLQASFKPVPPGKEKAMVFYGTSITQGGCASRPGMCHPAILGRRLNLPVINLGFSGNGKMEPEVAQLLGELDPSVYIIDCLPNMNANLVTQRAEPLVRTLRKAHAQTPIVLVEDRSYSNAAFLPAKQKFHAANRAALRKAFDNLTGGGIKGLHYIPGDHLFGDDGEATVDGSHPTDLGFVRMADALEAILKSII